MSLDPGQRLFDAADAAVAVIAAAWAAGPAGGPTPPDEVAVLDAADVVLNPDDPEVIAGRKVYVVPASFTTPAQFDRSEVPCRYTLGVIVVERYTDPGVMPSSWVRERVAWAGKTVFGPLRNPGLVLAGTMRPDFEGEDAGVIDEVWDLALLTQRKAFWSAMQFRYVELETF